jgi:parvulin-like peptidyl-prolyl isomerase
MKNISHKSLFRKSFVRLLAAPAAAVLMLAILSSPSFSRIIDGVAIIVNKDAVLTSEINEAMLPIVEEYRAKYAGDELKEKMAELRETIIDQAIENKLILQVAKSNRITVDEKTVDSRIDIVKKRFPSEEQFLQAMSARGLTLKEYRDQVAEQVLVQDTIKRVLGREITIEDDEVEQYYNANPDTFETVPRVKLAQIFLQVPKDASEEQVESVRLKAEKLSLLLEEGAEFSGLAREHSEGPYREKGGLVGVVGPEEILPDLEEIAFALGDEEISPIVQTGYGFHILKALETSPARKVGFDEAKPMIEELIREKKRSEKYADWIEKLKEDSYIDIRI